MTPGCETRATRSASARNRWRSLSVSRMSSRNTFSARSSPSRRAAYTIDVPPSPSTCTIANAPSVSGVLAGCRQVLGIDTPELRDAAADANADNGDSDAAGLCLGSFVTACLDALPTKSLSVPASTEMLLDTTNPATCDQLLPSGACMYA